MTRIWHSVDKTTFYMSLIAGVVAGLIATTLTEVFRTYYLRIVAPHFEERQYQGARIAGRWKIEGVFDGIRAERFIDLRQVGHVVKGDLISISGRDKGHVYLIEGTLVNVLFIGTYVAKDKSSSDRGVLAFKVISNGAEMVGQCLYSSDKHNEFRAPQVECTRSFEGQEGIRQRNSNQVLPLPDLPQPDQNPSVLPGRGGEGEWAAGGNLS